jgi:hypothetical protein
MEEWNGVEWERVRASGSGVECNGWEGSGVELNSWEWSEVE